MRAYKRVSLHSKEALNSGGRLRPTFRIFLGITMEHLCLYEVDENYISFLSEKAPLLFHNKKENERYRRKYIGVLLRVKDSDYFAPLSSFKEKHIHMPETLDFIKIGRRAVININCMFPAPADVLRYVDISSVPDYKYRSLLQIEYRFIRKNQDRIRKNAAEVYRQKTLHPETKLAKRCNDFALLETLCTEYVI